MGLKIKLWGIRGSLPAPYTPEYFESKVARILRDFSNAMKSSPELSVSEYMSQVSPTWRLGYGGHTACVEVRSAQQSIIIDGGSGIRGLGDLLCKGELGLGRGEVHILFTHFHWDHLIGLPFFAPIFIPGNKIHMYAVQDDLEENVRALFVKPRFPVQYDQLGAEIFYHKLEPRKPLNFKDISVTPYQLDHPDPCWGYKVESGGSTYAHCVDTECTRMSREELGLDLDLYKNVDLMLFDAQYSFLEAAERINWGHSSAPLGLDLALREGVRRVLFAHHDPAASDEKIDSIEAQSHEYFESVQNQSRKKGDKKFDLQWEFAREGMLIEI